TLAETVTLKSINSATLSGDGQVTAFTRVSPRTPYVDDDGGAFIELFTVRGEAEPVAFISNKTPVSAIQFHGDSIYFLSKRGDDKFTSLYKISTSGGEA